MRDVSNVPEGSEAFDGLHAELKERLVDWIYRGLTPTAKFNTDRTSYGMKHIFSSQVRQNDSDDTYVTNGEFKGAMLHCGFVAKDESALNWNFNVSKNSPALKRHDG